MRFNMEGNALELLCDALNLIEEHGLSGTTKAYKYKTLC